MSLRRLAVPLLVGMLLLPAFPAVAQIHLANGWEASDDSLAFATNDTFDTPPGWTIVEPDAFPAVISEIPGPDMLYRIDGTLATDTRVVNLHDGAGLPWLDEGRTPILGKAVVDDDGATWARQQHIVSLPSDCPNGWEEIDRCVPFDTITELIDLAAPDGTPVDPTPAADGFAFGTFASSGTTDRDGTLFSFAGDASVGTTVKVRIGDTIVVRGDARIGDGLGGRLRGYDASIIELRGDGMAAPTVPGAGALQAQARAVRQAGADANGVNRRVLDCPASRRGYVHSQFLVNGVGRNVGPTVDPGLDGGIPVFVSEIIPFDCGPLPDANGALVGPDNGPAAALVCASTRARHTPFTWSQDDQTITSASALAESFAIVTVGLPPETVASLSARIGGAHGGQFFTAGLEGVQLDSASHPDAMLWLGDSKVGIDDYGPKRFRDFELTVDGLAFDLLEQKQEQIGKAFDVGPSQKPVTNCPDFDFTFEDIGQVFSDGFESGDISAWAYTEAD